MAAALVIVAPAWAAETIVVSDNFDGYADTNAFLAKWPAVIGNGSAVAGAADALGGILTSDPLSTIDVPDLQGQGVDHVGATASSPGMVNQWGGVINQPLGNNPAFSIAPSATQNVVLQYDMYDGASGNERMSVGLRYTSVGATVASENILELGLYNSNSADPTNPGDWSAAPVNNAAQNAQPTTPGFYAGRGYGARATIFQSFAAPFAHPADWQYFRTTGETWGGQALGDVGFALELNRATDVDPIVTIGDIGAGWHRYTATISPTSVTITLDLFRDGLHNISTTPDEITGIRPGTTGVDAQMTFPITLTANGFNNLRMGGPSGLLSAGSGATVFDNVVLKLVDVVAPPANNADFDNDGDVDGADFLTWQRGLGLTGQPDKSTGDANGDHNVDAADLAIWQAHFGLPPGVGAMGAVPEPASVAMASCVLLGLGAASRAGRRAVARRW